MERNPVFLQVFCLDNHLEGEAQRIEHLFESGKICAFKNLFCTLFCYL